MKGTFKVKDYSLEKTLLSGQAFNWSQLEGNVYSGVLADSLIILKQLDEGIEYDIRSGKVNKDYLEYYLGIEENYDEILDSICVDSKVACCLRNYVGYRILRQDPFQTLISFINSANNNVKSIRKQLNLLSRYYGKEIDKDNYMFPDMETLSKLSIEDISKARVGFRGKYILKTSLQLSNQNFLPSLKDLSSELAHEKLITLPGVGDKVADCVLLLSYNRLERVPIDVWTRRILSTLYGINEKLSYAKMQEKAYEIHKQYSGYAFSFLFEQARLEGIKSFV